MKTLKITPPEGYEIDTEKSTFEEIVFKPVKKGLPKSWEELEEVGGCWVETGSDICEGKGFECTGSQKNIFATEAQAKASIALAQLSQLREVYRAGWQPDWNNDLEIKWGVEMVSSELLKTPNYVSRNFLSFQSAEIRDEFFNNFKDLIEEAAPLLFG